MLGKIMKRLRIEEVEEKVFLEFWNFGKGGFFILGI
jgi:hypothetical protein